MNMNKILFGNRSRKYGVEEYNLTEAQKLLRATIEWVHNDEAGTLTKRGETNGR